MVSFVKDHNSSITEATYYNDQNEEYSLYIYLFDILGHT